MGGEDHFLRLHQYIEMNPVRAGMVAAPQSYPWSSHAHNAFGAPSALVEPHGLYQGLGRDEVSRRTAYRALFGDALSDAHLSDIRQATRSCLPYGSDEFISALELAFGRRLRLLRPVQAGASASPN